MSKCISSQGEYSEHDMTYEGDVSLGEFVCTRCYVFDEDAALKELVKLRATVDRVRALADEAPTVPVHAGGGNLVSNVRMVSAGQLRAALDGAGESE